MWLRLSRFMCACVQMCSIRGFTVDLSFIVIFYELALLLPLLFDYHGHHFIYVLSYFKWFNSYYLICVRFGVGPRSSN